MAFLKTGQLLMRQYVKTEFIFNNIVKQNIPISAAVDKYIDKIKSVQVIRNNNYVSELLNFPYQTFYKLNKKYLESMISETYNMLKEKGLAKNPSVYVNLLRCYLDNKIDFDIHSVLKDMTDNQVPFNKDVCSSIIRYHSNRGEMNVVEILLNEMKTNKINLYTNDKYVIASGYIIAGQPEKSEIFIKENELDMLSHDMFFSRCFSYASIGDVTSLENILGEMKEKNITFSPKRYYNLYERLIIGNVNKSNLKKIIDLTKDNLVGSNTQLFVCLVNLNSADHFNYSVVIIEKLIDFIDDGVGFIELFGTSQCPVNTFKQALTLLGPKCRNISYKRNIFGDMDFDTAFEISQSFTKINAWKIVYYSLINKAISEKSLPFIEKTLDCAFKNLRWSQVNLLLQQLVFPSMKANEMVSSYNEILNHFPAFKNHILTVLFMKHLCSGDFDCYNELISKEKHFRKLSARFDCNYLAIELRDNLTLKEMERWSIEAEKCFHQILINEILTKVIIYEMIKLSKNESSNSFDELIRYAKEWNLEFSSGNLKSMLKAVPQHAELIRSSIVVKNNFSEKEASVD